MDSRTLPGNRALDIAIIGGGASGTLAAVQLLQHAAARGLPLRIRLIDQYGRHGLGQAYSTDNQAHLLNAMTGQMSALPGDPEHLIRWAAADASSATGRAATSAGEIRPTTFLSRPDYGRYLRDTLADAERRAVPVARLTRISSEVLAVRPGSGDCPVRLVLPDGQIEADMVVLATGNTPGRLPFEVPPSERIVAEPWRP